MEGNCLTGHKALLECVKPLIRWSVNRGHYRGDDGVEYKKYGALKLVDTV